MRATLHGSADQPAIAILSTFDPCLDGYAAGVRQLVDVAGRRGMTPVAVLLDPPPAVFLNAPGTWPVYSAVVQRVAWLRALGATVVAVHFDAADLAFAAPEFFDLLAPHVDLREFWLKYRQTVGSGPRGSGVGTRLEAARRGIKVVGLPADDLGAEAAVVRRLLHAGAPGKAARLVGRGPVLVRPEQARLQLAWGAGRYEFAICGSTTPTLPLRGPVTLELRPVDGGGVEVHWPDPHVRYLLALRGPGDALPDPIDARAAVSGLSS